MALLTFDRNPPARVLRQFAGIWLPVACAVIGWAVYRRLGSWPGAMTVWGTGAALGLIGVVRPSFVRPVWVAWLTAAYPIGWVVSHAVLGVVYFGVMTPIGFLMRMLGYDPMQRRFQRGSSSYWVSHDPGKDVPRYLRQF